MSSAELAIDLEDVVRNLVVLGLDETYVRSQFCGLPDEPSWLEEVAALLAESEAALTLRVDMPLPLALFQLVEALRHAGARAVFGHTSDGTPSFSLLGPQPRTYALTAAADASVLSLVRAVAAVVPRAQQLLLAADSATSGGVLTLIALERGSFVALRAALGDRGLDTLFERVAGDAAGTLLTPCNEPLATPDLEARFAKKLAELSGPAKSQEGLSERICSFDPRVAWPTSAERPPGDEFLEFCASLANGALGRCVANSEDRALANLLYRFALATTVGAHYDVAAARQNPGRSAQRVLGLGQLTWAWFIFEALNATEEAAISGRLLDHEWVRAQERQNVAERQRAYYDLGAYLRRGARGASLERVFPLVALAERSGWQDPLLLEAALATHSETQGELLTQQPLFYLWPATLYALARKADAGDLLPPQNPFLAHPLSVAAVDLRAETVQRLKEQLLRFSLLDEARFAPLLDPLPVVVDVVITEVDAENAHGRTMLAARDDAEHRVVAPHAGRAMRPGEIWLFEVDGSEASEAQATFDDLGEVSFNVARPVGHWLDRA